jgi:hypothetical protein
MKCSEIEQLIEDYEYGELSPPLMQEVEAHLAFCRNCSRLFESLQSEAKMYETYGKTLESAIAIAPSMWDKVHDELAAESAIDRNRLRGKYLFGRSFSFSKLLPDSAIARRMLYASILMLISIGSALLVIHYHDGNKPAMEATKAPQQVQPVEQRSLQNALLAIQRAEREYVEAIRVLNNIVERHKASLDPKLATELERNLKAIDEAIASTQKAYHDHPTDPELAQYMLAAYQKKVELLQELALTIT